MYSDIKKKFFLKIKILKSKFILYLNYKLNSYSVYLRITTHGIWNLVIM
jgi:hypothetical protein